MTEELDRWTSPFDLFTQELMSIAHNKERTILQQRQDFENMVFAIKTRSEEQLLLVLHQRGILPKDGDLLKP